MAWAKADRRKIAKPGRQREDAALRKIDELQRPLGGESPTLPDAEPANESKRLGVRGGQRMSAIVEEAELRIAIAAAAPAELRSRFQHGDGLPAVAQPERRGKSGKPAADDEGAAGACRCCSDRITHSAAAPSRL
jgi:hypothetical protein